jgi:4-carboxymuconolactone decarboxylase
LTREATNRRLPPFDPRSATVRQAEVLDTILSGLRGNLNGPFLGWIHSPELADRAQRLGAFCRYDTGLDLRLSELAILTTAARWKSQAEWAIHFPIGLQAGLDSAELDALRRGLPPRFVDSDEVIVYRFATELYDFNRVSDATYQQAVSRFGATVVVNLVGLLGYYALVAMTLNVFEMRAENQTELPFDEPDMRQKGASSDAQPL